MDLPSVGGPGRAASATLAEEPTNFFMTLRDIAFWIRSARSDAALSRLNADARPETAFDQLYDSRPDPYGVNMSQYRYQLRKYRMILSMLPNRRYDKVLDIGCGLGVFTRQLSPHANEVLGIDISGNAVRQARRMSAGLANVDFERADIGSYDAAGRQFDLIVLADILYYLAPLTEGKLAALAEKMAGYLAPNGLLLLVNQFFFAIDMASRVTRQIHEAFSLSPGLARIAEHKRAFYLTTILERPA